MTLIPSVAAVKNPFRVYPVLATVTNDVTADESYVAVADPSAVPSFLSNVRAYVLAVEVALNTTCPAGIVKNPSETATSCVVHAVTSYPSRTNAGRTPTVDAYSWFTAW